MKPVFTYLLLLCAVSLLQCCRAQIDVPTTLSPNEDHHKNKDAPVNIVLHLKNLRKVHLIHVLPQSTSSLLSHAGNSTRAIDRVQSSGKCSCDIQLIGEKDKNRINVQDVYDSKLDIKTCDAQEQQRCIEFCLSQANKSANLDGKLENSNQTLGQKLCDLIKKDESKRKLALFSTVRCEGQTAGFLAYKRVSKWTNYVYPMRLTCVAGEHKVEPEEKGTMSFQPEDELDGADTNVRDGVIISTEKPTKPDLNAGDQIPAIQSDDSSVVTELPATITKETNAKDKEDKEKIESATEMINSDKSKEVEKRNVLLIENIAAHTVLPEMYNIYITTTTIPPQN